MRALSPKDHKWHTSLIMLFSEIWMRRKVMHKENCSVLVFIPKKVNQSNSFENLSFCLAYLWFSCWGTLLHWVNRVHISIVVDDPINKNVISSLESHKSRLVHTKSSCLSKFFRSGVLLLCGRKLSSIYSTSFSYLAPFVWLTFFFVSFFVSFFPFLMPVDFFFLSSC